MTPSVLSCPSSPQIPEQLPWEPTGAKTPKEEPSLPRRLWSQDGEVKLLDSLPRCVLHLLGFRCGDSCRNVRQSGVAGHRNVAGTGKHQADGGEGGAGNVTP